MSSLPVDAASSPTYGLHQQPVTELAGNDIPGFVVHYTPVAMAQRAAKLRVVVRRRVVSLLISAVVTVGLFFVFDVAVGSGYFWLLVASLAYSVVLLIVSIVKMYRARKTTSKVPHGPALQVDARGLVLATSPEGERVDWEQISLLKGLNRFLNPGPRLQIKWGSQSQWSVPIILLDALPGTIDSAMRAYSRGRFGLDLSAVDELW